MKSEGGLELIFPGVYYENMKTQQRIIVNNLKEFVGFAGLKNEFMKDNNLKIDNPDEIPKIGYSLQAFQMIPDSEFQYLIDERMNKQRQGRRNCELCGRFMERDHIMRCEANKIYRNIRHNDTVIGYVSALRKQYQA